MVRLGLNITKKIQLLICLYLLLFFNVLGQLSFEMIMAPPPFPQKNIYLNYPHSGKIDFIDFDTDGDLDLIKSGRISLYINDGSGNFIEEKCHPLVGVGAVVVKGDVDGDNDEDLFLYNNEGLSEIYRNNVGGNFSKIDIAFLTFQSITKVVFFDADNDSDNDLLITGQINDWNRAILYENDGNGNFTERFFHGIPYTDTFISYGDVDGDQDQDLLLIDDLGAGPSKTRLYLNNGLGFFSEVGGTPFPEYMHTSAFSDIDNDGDLDVMLSGSQYFASTIYLNDGKGNFTEKLGTPFPPLGGGSITFIDYDNDNDQDLLLVGIGNTGESQTTLYENDGRGNFKESVDNSFLSYIGMSVAFGDVDSDRDLDLLCSSGGYYINDGKGRFLQSINTPFYNYTGLNGKGGSGGIYGNIFDKDNDGDSDVLIVGKDQNGKNSIAVFDNENNGIFQEYSKLNLPDEIYFINASFHDFDGDQDLDFSLLIYDWAKLTSVLQVYYNDGSGLFNEGFNTTLFSDSRIHSFDADSDEDIDILISGNYGSTGLKDRRILLNDGRGSFTERISFGEEFANSEFYLNAHGDVDGDGDIDLIYRNMETFRIYTNDGNGIYNEFVDLDLGNYYWRITLGDVDGDNDLDMFCVGRNENNIDAASIFLNDGKGNFSLDTRNDFMELYNFKPTLYDIDGDKDLDVFYSGVVVTNEPGPHRQVVANLYLNDGTGNYSLEECHNLPYGLSEYYPGDIDNNGSADILLFTQSSMEAGKSFLHLYRNTTCSYYWYADNDGDGFGNANDYVWQCEQPLGYVLDNTDCNDSFASSIPSPDDIPGSAIDSNCDGVFLWFQDLDRDGYGTDVVVTSQSSVAKPGESSYNTDCNDHDSSIYPTNIELPSSLIDSNCDGLYTWYEDLDKDGFGSVTLTTTVSPEVTQGVSGNSEDCDDQNPFITTSPMPAPTITISGDSTATLQLISSSNKGNQWYHHDFPIDGATESTFQVDRVGKYTVQYSIGDCISEMSGVTLITVTDIEEATENQINIFPNPFNDYLIINSTLWQNGVTVYVGISDISGKVLLQSEINGSSEGIRLDLSKYPSGQYLLQIEHDNRYYIYKILKR